MKIKWKVAEAPTGRYRSFEKRGWPVAIYESGHYAGYISCADEYYPANVKTGQHAPLTIGLYDYSQGSQNRKSWRFKKEFATLAEAKEGLIDALKKHPDWIPKKDTA